VQKSDHSATGPKALLRSAIQTLSPALWRSLANCWDALSGRAAKQHADRHRSTLERLDQLQRTLVEHNQREQVRSFMEWIEHAPMPLAPLISVVTPTRDRRDFLERAVASVTGQTYANWELVVVDDGSTDGTPDFLARLADPRIRSYRCDGRGACAARNVALANLTGEIVAYLDDDNIMHPHWLKSVAWAFTQRPETNVLYGAFLIDDVARVDPRKHGELPRLFFRPYNHHDVTVDNIADASCIAHRAGLAEARFDETLREMGDWDLLLRLTRDAPPLALPAIACLYTTDAPNRLSHGPTFQADLGTEEEPR
jgi:hypothetical protein